MLPSAVHSNISFLGSGLLVANYVGAIAAALRFPAMFNIWTMGGGHALLAVSTDSRAERVGVEGVAACIQAQAVGPSASCLVALMRTCIGCPPFHQPQVVLIYKTIKLDAARYSQQAIKDYYAAIWWADGGRSRMVLLWAACCRVAHALHAVAGDNPCWGPPLPFAAGDCCVADGLSCSACAAVTPVLASSPALLPPFAGSTSIVSTCCCPSWPGACDRTLHRQPQQAPAAAES